MNRETVIQLAREAGFNTSNGFSQLIVRHSNGSWIDIAEELEAFANAIEQRTLERAAQVVETAQHFKGSGWVSTLSEPTKKAIAAAIRALGEKA